MQADPPDQRLGISPETIARHARWNAKSDEEQAVSIEKLGPRRSKTYESRLATMLAVSPVTKEASMAAKSAGNRHE